MILPNESKNMSLTQRIDSDLKDAMRGRDSAKIGILRMLKSALKYAAIDKGGAEVEMDDAEVTQVIRKQVKQRQDSIEGFEKGGRTELAAQERAEIAVLEEYLPAAMPPEELAQLVCQTIAEVGASSRAQMGAVMKALQPKIAGRADGRTVSEEVQRQLGS